MRSVSLNLTSMSTKDLFKFFVTFVFFFCCANGQYPASTLEWDYMPLTGSDNVDIIKGVTLNKGGTNAKLNNKSTWRNPSITQLGWMFEGYEIACGGPNANLNMGDTFGTHIWIYFTDITTDQTIWCKEWLQTETNKTLNSLRLCLYLRSGHFAVLWNPQIATKHLTNENLTDSYNYETVKLDLVAKFGWTYLAVNFKTNQETKKASIWAYYSNHDQCELVSSTYTLPGPIVDDNNYILCIGGTAYPNRTTLKYELYQPLMALVNGWVFVKGALIYRYNAFDYYGFQCHDYCQICRNKDQPKCLEDYETHVLHYWDFAPFRWYRPVFDYGSKTLTIGLGIVMVGQGLYTNNNGMWFDGGRTLTPGAIRWAIFSFTVDCWFKFYNNAGGTVIESLSGSPRSWKLFFTAPKTVSFTLNGNTVSTTFTYTAATDKNKWMIVQASTAKQGLLLSNICLKVNDDAIYCQQKPTFYDDTNPIATQTLRIGNSFNGYMRKIKIYDYPKTLPSMLMMYKTSSQCYKFHWTQPQCSYCDVDYNFTCYTSCSERNQWDYDCKTCGGRCYTCSGNDRYRCFSCSETLYRFHEKCTCCPETCGDGFFLGDSHYQCDDGNNNNDDGCDKNCRYEAGFSCIPGTPKSATKCTEICGDGRKINHACDDANTVSGDGCSSTCTVETGYQCTGGDRNTVDVCWEICGDGKDYGTYGCDDGNTSAGDGCDASCVVEIGWTCSGGTKTNKDTCTEICGDGFRTYKTCDDANTANGDGCSSTCTVENGWQCGSEAPSICWKISQPSIIDSYIDKSTISLTFNETVILSTGWTSSDFDFSLSGPLTPYSVSWSFTSATALKVPTPMQTVWFSYSSPNQFFGNGSETLTITFKDMTRIQNSAYNFGMINSSISFIVFPQESSEGCGELIFEIIIYFVMAGILGIGILSTLAGHSMAIAWMALSIIQFVNLLPQTMIYAPSCMASFSQGFDVFGGKFKDSVISTITINNVVRDDFYNKIDYKYIRAGNISSAILYNAFDLIIVWCLVLIIIPIMYAIQRIFFNSNYALKLHIEKFRNAVIYVLVLFSYMRLSLLSMLNLRYANLDNDLSIVSTTLAGCISLIVIGYPLYEAWNVLQYYREIQSQRKPTYFRLYILYSDFGVSSPLQYMYFWQFFLRRFLYTLMIIGCPQQEYLTLAMSTLMHLIVMLYVTYVLPFTSRIRNVAVMVAEGGMVVIHGACFALLKDTPSTGLDHYTINSVLFFLVVLIVICILAVLILFDSLAHIKKICKICKREPDDEPDKAILDSFGSSDSLTEREISLEDKDNDEIIELKDPKKEQQLKEEEERIQLIKKGKLKSGRPQTPPKIGTPLVSQFGRAPFKETQGVDDEKEGEGEGDKSKTENIQ